MSWDRVAERAFAAISPCLGIAKNFRVPQQSDAAEDVHAAIRQSGKHIGTGKHSETRSTWTGQARLPMG